MCRLFGFRSVIPSQVHRSLLSAENALGTQSSNHPDGWGVAYYVDGAPHLTRSPQTALSDHLFRRLSGVVASGTVLAHVRKATQGENTVLNCHPFQYGRFTFAHNGDIPGFDAVRESLMSHVEPRLRRYVLGETDSEVLFYLLLTMLARRTPLAGDVAADDLARAIDETVSLVRSITDQNAETAALLTFIVTNGSTMLATVGGKPLFYSTYKNRCADRDTCASLSPECEAPTRTGGVNHLVLSSEPLHGENIWIPIEAGTIIGVDRGMQLFTRRIGERALPVVAA
jgi:predicted glutamine amidotransferase